VLSVRFNLVRNPLAAIYLIDLWYDFALFYAALAPDSRLLKKASCLFQNKKSKNCDFCFSYKINDSGVIDFAGISIYR
jgi:hypothetical protein